MSARPEIIHFSRQKHNPMEVIAGLCPGADVSHITYDPCMWAGQYYIINQCGHDGTLMFTYQMFGESLLRLINRKTCFIPTEPKDWDTVRDIKYTIGPMRHVIVFGRVKLRCSENPMPGQRERIRIPVICEYILK